MFTPRLALASLSGASDAAWARAGAPYAGAAFLGGIAVCPETRTAARAMVARGREEFLPRDPREFLGRELDLLSAEDLRVGVNIRAVDTARLTEVASYCARHDAIIEINAHCRQAEMCAAGAGEALLRDRDRLAEQVAIAAETGGVVSVKVRAEVEGVDLIDTAAAVQDAGASIIHVDAMDSEPIIADVVDRTNLFVIANNGVRDRTTAMEYLGYGADAVSVGRPSDQPAVLSRVSQAVATWEDSQTAPSQTRARRTLNDR